MGPEHAQFLAQSTLWTLLVLSLPILGITTVVSLIFSVFQAVTQIQDQTLPFTMKFVTIMIVLSVFGVWMVAELSDLFIGAMTIGERDIQPF
ncbi:MAG: flagellar biosynthetic protein FliQ [Pseudomonadota bacterium]